MQRHYTTTDFSIASYLCADNFTMAGTERLDGRIHFRFENTEELQTALQDYFNGTALIKPQALSGAIRDLKSLIHSAP